MDASLFHFIYGFFRHPLWHSGMGWVTHLGDTVVVAAVSLVGLLESVWARRKRDAQAGSARELPVLVWAGVMLMPGLTSKLKAVVGRLRPYEIFSLDLHPGDLGWAFPSGHASAVFALAMALGYRWPRWRPVWFGLAAVVGLSRIALGLHWPSDVLAGAALGSVTIFGLAQVEKNLKRGGDRTMLRVKRLAAILTLSVALLPGLGLAEEEKVESTSSEITASVSPSAPADASPPSAAATEAAPEQAPVVPPALKPITITFSGDLTAVDTAGPSITVQDRYGVKKEIAVPAEAKIAQGEAAKSLSDLKVGDKLTVEYTYDVATGKRTAQSISIGEAAPAAS